MLVGCGEIRLIQKVKIQYLLFRCRKLTENLRKYDYQIRTNFSFIIHQKTEPNI